ncbi:hypothetical protein BOTBODRAFT_109962 [Botryobasidium botryosum FD-172 SS1]|uniref:Inositol-pentakisphosphate 2-kinase n=1 Tax=Botryobasidium botryosum (strain FD-172 SS1) TaxID=930990 RepID=A0A067MSI7_BOTB1|nr:hypothetical protein BOTBODRAFT_109962 [Botryobasidium botryosum FD-172 SS1]
MARPDASLTAPHDWAYISEGGATIVFSYAGHRHPIFTGTVLRLRKAPLSDTEDEDEEAEDATIAFQARVTSRLIGPAHLPRLDACAVSRPWLEELARISHHRRPEARRAKDAINVRRRKAVLATDLVGGHAWAVEIKPKWAFLPNPAHLSPATRPIKAAHCRFCMHTHRRAASDDPAAITRYCPLDLFSGDPARIERALSTLWDAWIHSNGAVNNLKLFVDGATIRPNDQTAVDAISHILFPDSTQPPSLPAFLPKFISTVLPLLTSTPLLARLSTLQRTLDALDIEGLAALYSSPTSLKPLVNPASAAEPGLDEWADFVSTYLARHPEFQSQLGDNKEGEEDDEDPEEKIARIRSHPAEIRYYTLAYLLSGTFKDCSVILRFPQTNEDDKGDPKEDGGDGGDDGPGEPTITAIDLDPKNIARLPKWAELDAQIVRAFAERADLREVARCVDARTTGAGR